MLIDLAGREGSTEAEKVQRAECDYSIASGALAMTD